MATRTLLPSAGFLTAAMIGLVGCIDRTETITIEPSGRTHIELEFKTKSFGELYGGDAVPKIEGGWMVEERSERDDDGEEIFSVLAEATFPSDVELPSTYAGPRDPDPDTFLQFPTTLLIEDRDDGTYYHFKRVYPARPWAMLTGARKQLEEAIEEIDKDWEDMSAAERTTVITILARFETQKYRAFARAAFEEAMPGAPQDVWLAAYAAVMRTADQLDYPRILELMTEEDEELREEALEEEARAFEAAVITSLRGTLLAMDGVGLGNVNAFLRRIDWEKRYYEITEDLGDDKFAITVSMPGDIVGHNGDEAAADRGVTWKFSGERMRDDVIELMVTSRLAH